MRVPNSPASPGGSKVMYEGDGLGMRLVPVVAVASVVDVASVEEGTYIWVSVKQRRT